MVIGNVIKTIENGCLFTNVGLEIYNPGLYILKDMENDVSIITYKIIILMNLLRLER